MHSQHTGRLPNWPNDSGPRQSQRKHPSALASSKTASTGTSGFVASSSRWAWIDSTYHEMGKIPELYAVVDERLVDLSEEPRQTTRANPLQAWASAGLLALLHDR